MKFRQQHLHRIALGIVGFSAWGMSSFFLQPTARPYVSDGEAISSLTSHQPQRTPAQQVSIQNLKFCEDLYTSICRKKGVTRDPTGVVYRDVDGELMALRIYEEIIRNHPDWNPEQIDEELVQKIYTQRRTTKVVAAFQWVTHALEEVFQEQPVEFFNDQDRQSILKRIRSVELQLPPPATIYADEPDLYTKTDVYFERTESGQMRLRVGGAFLMAVRSWFNLVFTLAHELGHAIDPCELKNVGLSFDPYRRLGQCFIDQKIVRESTHCSPNDQLSETFADWIAVQVTAKALAKYAQEFDQTQIRAAAINSVKDLCEDEGDGTRDVDTNLHPSPERRIRKIFGNQPEIRRLLGCPALDVSLEPHCHWNWNLPL